MRQYYSTFEFCNALKPWLHRWISSHGGADRWLYVDADTWCLGSLSAAFRALDGCDVLLTRHSQAPSTSLREIRRDRGLCMYGTLNGGFVAMRRSAAADAFVAWWLARLISHARECIAEGEYSDQRWLDVAQSHFPEIRSERIPGVNIGHWNLHELRVANDQLVDRGNTPLLLAHFSQVRIAAGGHDMRDFPATDAAQLALFSRVAADYARAVERSRARIEGCVIPDRVAVASLDAPARDLVIRAMQAGTDEVADFAAAIAALPAARRRAAWRDLRAAVRVVGSSLATMMRARSIIESDATRGK